MNRAVRPRARASRLAAAFALGALLGTIALACTPEDPTPESTADCQASRVCDEQGRCTMDYGTRKCVVGSDADCARSKACQKDRRCVKVGDVCGTAPGE